MKKNTLVIAIVAAVAFIIVVSVLKIRPLKSTKTDPDTYTVAPFTYKLMPVEKLGLAAKVVDKEITYDELASRSPVLRDLLLTKYKLLSQAAQKKIAGLPKASRKHKVTLYMESPDKNLNLAGRNPDFSVEFSNERPTNAVLKIDEKVFNRNDLDFNQIFFSLNETKLFHERLRMISELFKNQFLLKLSKEKNMTIQAFINKAILSSPVQAVTDQEVASFAKMRGITLDGKDHSLGDRLRSIIAERNIQSSINQYIAKNHPSTVGYIYFSPPNFKIPLEEKVGVFTSSKADKVQPTLVVFSAIKCPGCRDLANQLNEIRSSYKNQIQVGFVHLSSESDWREQMAAQASLCLAEQSTDAFWQFYTKISQSSEELSEEFIKTTAQSTDAKFETFQKCFLAQTYKDKLQDHLEYVNRLGITISPTLILGGQVLAGQIPEEQLNTAIHSEIK